MWLGFLWILYGGRCGPLAPRDQVAQSRWTYQVFRSITNLAPVASSMDSFPGEIHGKIHGSRPIFHIFTYQSIESWPSCGPLVMKNHLASQGQSSQPPRTEATSALHRWCATLSESDERWQHLASTIFHMCHIIPVRCPDSPDFLSGGE